MQCHLVTQYRVQMASVVKCSRMKGSASPTAASTTEAVQLMKHADWKTWYVCEHLVPRGGSASPNVPPHAARNSAWPILGRRVQSKD